MPARSPKPAAWLAAALLATFPLAAAGCDVGEDPVPEGEPDTITVYSSLPLQAGSQRSEAAAIRRGIDLALSEHGGEVDEFTVEHRSLDNSLPEKGGPAPEEEAANARMASQDDSAVAYIGGLSFASAAISIPILNEGGMVQVSPGATYGGLTRETPASQAGEPDKYYPTGERNFARIVPIDTLEAQALAGELADAGCDDAFVALEDEVSTRALATLLVGALQARGVALVGEAAVDGETPELDALRAAAAEQPAGCAVIVATPGPAASGGYRELGRALPDARLFGSHGACRAVLARGGQALNRRLQERVSCVSYLRELDAYPGGEGIELEDPAALYGYEAMRLVLDAIGDGQGDRLEVRRALLATEGRDSPLGEYSLDEQGDTTLDGYAVYRLRPTGLRQVRLVEAGG